RARTCKTEQLLKTSRVGRGELYSVLPPDEDAIWQSEVRPGGSGGQGRTGPPRSGAIRLVSDMPYRGHRNTFIISN
ncbi:MAG: hypothetical protein KGI80_05820, partial [Verrucomicrobiota bacterium]|nr:hypothetical protein [Verrucomicrobiota bacterium]